MINENIVNTRRVTVAVFINSHVEIFKINLKYMDLSRYNVVVVSPIPRAELDDIINISFDHISVPPNQDFDRNFLSLCHFAKNMDDDSWIIPLADDDIILNSQTVNGERLSDFAEEIKFSKERGSSFALFEHAEYSTNGIERHSVMRESSQFPEKDHDITKITLMTSPYLVSFPRFCGIAYQAKLLKIPEISNFVGTLHAYAAPMYLGVMNGFWGEFIPSPRFAYYAPQKKTWSWTNKTRIFLGIMHFASLSTSLGYDERAFSDWPHRFRFLLSP